MLRNAGDFREDVKSGRGILFLSNGEYYDGEFSNDLAEGEGSYTRITGETVTGRWNKNIFVD